MKVLIIGLGSIAQKHIASILKLVPDTLFYALRSNINSKKTKYNKDKVNILLSGFTNPDHKDLNSFIKLLDHLQNTNNNSFYFHVVNYYPKRIRKL